MIRHTMRATTSTTIDCRRSTAWPWCATTVTQWRRMGSISPSVFPWMTCWQCMVSLGRITYWWKSLNVSMHSKMKEFNQLINHSDLASTAAGTKKKLDPVLFHHCTHIKNTNKWFSEKYRERHFDSFRWLFPVCSSTKYSGLCPALIQQSYLDACKPLPAPPKEVLPPITDAKSKHRQLTDSLQQYYNTNKWGIHEEVKPRWKALRLRAVVQTTVVPRIRNYSGCYFFRKPEKERCSLGGGRGCLFFPRYKNVPAEE